MIHLSSVKIMRKSTIGLFQLLLYFRCRVGDTPSSGKVANMMERDNKKMDSLCLPAKAGQYQTFYFFREGSIITNGIPSVPAAALSR